MRFDRPLEWEAKILISNNQWKRPNKNLSTWQFFLNCKIVDDKVPREWGSKRGHVRGDGSTAYAHARKRRRHLGSVDPAEIGVVLKGNNLDQKRKVNAEAKKVA